MSEQVKTPGQVLFEFIHGLKFWDTGVTAEQKQFYESAAIAAHQAVEEQRRQQSVPKCECGSKSTCEVMGQYLCIECLKDAFLMSNNGRLTD